MVKESKVYLHFLNNSWKMLVVLPIIGGSIGWWVSQNQLTLFRTEIQLEVEYSQDEITKKALVADEVVGVLRSRPVHSQLRLDEDSRVVVHKNGPLLVNLVVENPDSSVSMEDSIRLKNFTEEKYRVVELGRNLGQSPINNGLFVLIGTGIGLLLGVITSLIKTYLRTF